MNGRLLTGPLALLIIGSAALVGTSLVLEGQSLLRIGGTATSSAPDQREPRGPVADLSQDRDAGGAPDRADSNGPGAGDRDEVIVRQRGPILVDTTPVGDQRLAGVTMPQVTTAAPEPVRPVARSEPDQTAAGAAAPTRANLRVYAQVDIDDGGLGDYTASAYATLLRQRLLAIVQAKLGVAAVADGDDSTFRTQLAGDAGGIERLCEQAGSVRMLLADVIAAQAGSTTLDSAFGPGVRFTAINCDDGRRHQSQRKRLEPRRDDTFVYEQDFAQAAQRFVASRGYFLQP